MPESFIKYLAQDGVMWHQDKNVISYYTSPIEKNESNDYSDWESEGSQSDSHTDSEDEAKTIKVDPLKDFPKLHEHLKNTIKELGNENCSEINEDNHYMAKKYDISDPNDDYNILSI